MTDSGKRDRDDDGRIRDAAATWIARLAGQASASNRRDLEKWLSADSRHAAAYQRMVGRFDHARVLRRSRAYAARPQPARWGWRPIRITGVLAGIVVALILVLPYPSFFQRTDLIGSEARKIAAGDSVGNAGSRRIATSTGIRSVGLNDGSIITLDNSSAVEVSFGANARRIRLLRGRARFSVAHDGRSFTVLAGGGSVTARGTIFDVLLGPRDRVAVSLHRGVVDVAAAGRPPTGTPAMRRLRAGQKAAYAGGVIVSRRDAASIADVPWIVGAVEFDNVTLGYVVEAANQGVGPTIRIGSPSLAALRVSGRFDMNDHGRLAKNLARLFNMRVQAGADTVDLARP